MLPPIMSGDFGIAKALRGSWIGTSAMKRMERLYAAFRARIYPWTLKELLVGFIM